MPTLNPIKRAVEKKYKQKKPVSTEPTIKTYIFIGCLMAMIIIGGIMWLQQNLF